MVFLSLHCMLTGKWLCKQSYFIQLLGKFVECCRTSVRRDYHAVTWRENNEMLLRKLVSGERRAEPLVAACRTWGCHTQLSAQQVGCSLLYGQCPSTGVQLVARPTAHTGQKSEHRGNLPQNPVVLENVDSSAHDARQGERRRRVQLPSMSKESMVIPHAAVSEVLQASLAGLCL